MSTLSAYVLRQTLTPLLLTVAIALLALLTERMLRLLDLVLSSSGSLQPLVQLLTFLIPHYVALALPVAFFLGVLLVFSGLQQRSELDAIGAAGVGMGRLIRPVLALAAVLALLSALNFGWAQPYARYLYRALLHNVTAAMINIAPQENTFMEISGVTFMAEEVAPGGQRFARVFIYRQAGDGSSEAVTARSGQMTEAEGGERSVLVLEDGVQLEVRPAPAGGAAPGGAESRALTFERLRLPISLVGDTMFRARGRDQREYTLWELWPFAAQPPGELLRAEAVGEFNDRVLRTLTILFLPFFAAGIAVGQRRVQRAYVVFVGLLTLVIYNEALEFGRYYVSVGEAPTLLAQWLPFLLMAGGSLWLFHRTAYRVQRTWALYDALAGVERFARSLLPHGRRRGESA